MCGTHGLCGLRREVTTRRSSAQGCGEGTGFPAAAQGTDVTSPRMGIAMHKQQSRLLVAALALAVPAASASTVASAAGARSPAGPPRSAPALQANRPAPPGLRARPAGAVPVRIPNPSAYIAQKAAANAAAARVAARASASAPPTAALAPSLAR